MNQKLLSTVIVILAVVVAVVLVAAITISISGIEESAAADRWSLLPAIVISSGVLIAILSFARDRHKQEAEQKRHRSQIFLERASLAFDSTHDLLRDQNNERIIWVRAARTLLRAVRLGKQIEDTDYKLAYELEAERARNNLYDALTIENSESGERSPLPPAFFYGIKGWRICSSLDQAAIESSAKINVYSPSIDVLPPRPRLVPLSVKSVTAIYNFMEYPNDYDDPLDDLEEWGDNWEDSHGIDQGAKRYVAHTRQKVAVGGKLHDRKPVEKPK